MSNSLPAFTVAPPRPCQRKVSYPECLPPRLQRIAPLIAQGLPNPVIAARLCLAPHSVENYISELKAECNCSNRYLLAMQLRACLLLR